MDGNPKNFDEKRDRPSDLPDDQIDYPSLDDVDHQKEASEAWNRIEGSRQPSGVEYSFPEEAPGLERAREIFDLADRRNLDGIVLRLKEQIQEIGASEKDLARIDEISKRADLQDDKWIRYAKDMAVWIYLQQMAGSKPK